MMEQPTPNGINWFMQRQKMREYVTRSLLNHKEMDYAQFVNDLSYEFFYTPKTITTFLSQLESRKIIFIDKNIIYSAIFKDTKINDITDSKKVD